MDISPKEITDDQQALEKMIISHQENANQNHNKIHHLTLKDEGYEEIGMHCKWQYEMVQLLWKTAVIFWNSIKQLTTSIPLYTPKDVKNIGPQKDLYLECL